MIEEILMYFFNKVMYILNEYKNLNMAYKLVLLLYFFINCFTLSAQTTDSVIMTLFIHLNTTTQSIESLTAVI